MIQIGDLTLGKGVPKICVPIIGTTKSQILKEAQFIAQHKVELVEWRLDHYEDVEDHVQVLALLKQLKACLEHTLLLCTFRTKREGGAHEFLNEEDYHRLNERLIKSGDCDLIDLELFMDKHLLKNLIETAHDHGVYVIISNHDFQKTPGYDDLFARLHTMQRLGGDVLKIAVMPKNKKDVLTLLQVTADMEQRAPHQAIVSMAMGTLGMLSRICGETFGSAITFASLNGSSAPGQLPYDEMKTVLDILHKQLSLDA